MQIHQEILDLQRKAGLTQGQIAQACGCSQANVSYHASGKVEDPRPSAKFAKGLADLKAKHAVALSAE